MVRSWIRLPMAVVLLSFYLIPANAGHTVQRRQDNTTVVVEDDAEKVVLKPTVPSIVDPEQLDVLKPDTNITLFFSRTVASPQKRSIPSMLMAQIDVAFKHPTVVLDHSNFVGNISCTNNTLLAEFSDQSGYDKAVTSWPKKSTLILVTSASGCGTDESRDDDNGYFVTTSVSFTPSSQSVLAEGAFASLGNKTIDSANIQWGELEVSPRSSNSSLQARDCPNGLDWCGSIDWSWVVNPEVLGKDYDDDAPWEKAWLIFQRPEEEDGEDEKRSLEARKAQVEKAFKVYCVDCEFSIGLTLGGNVLYHNGVLAPFIEVAEVYLRGNMHIGAYLGIEASITWKDEWKKTLFHKK